eukprot:5365074-Prymnesium_polylepis.1
MGTLQVYGIRPPRAGTVCGVWQRTHELLSCRADVPTTAWMAAGAAFRARITLSASWLGHDTRCGASVCAYPTNCVAWLHRSRVRRAAVLQL